MATADTADLLRIEEADAWYEYRDEIRNKIGVRYAEVEPWAWVRLQQRLRAVRARERKLKNA